MNSVILAFASRGPDILSQAWKALFMHRFRSLLSTTGIVFATAALVTMLAIAEGAKKESIEQLGNLGIDTILVRNSRMNNETPGSPFSRKPEALGYGDVTAIRQLPGVEKIIVVRERNAFFAELGDSDVTRTLAVRNDYFSARGLRLARGRFISDLDVKNDHQVCVLGAELAERLRDGGLDDIVHVDGDPYRVVGVLKPRGDAGNKALPVALRDFDNAAFVPLPERSRPAAFAGGNDFFSEIIIKISDTRLTGPISKGVHHTLLWNRNGAENFELIVPEELLSQARQAQGLFNIILGSIAGILLLAGGIGIMNLMLANVSERTREIGVRRAIGASRGHIIAQFLGESILLTVFGGGMGIVLGACAALGVNFFIEWRVSISLWPLFAALFMSVGVGVVSGIYPAMKAAEMDPVDALRQI
ncbi:MAG: ABC transporter permease [Thermodesulfobacteriota bacterium]